MNMVVICTARYMATGVSCEVCLILATTNNQC